MLAMSGGVDSSVAAALLKEAKAWKKPGGDGKGGGKGGGKADTRASGARSAGHGGEEGFSSGRGGRPIQALQHC